MLVVGLNFEPHFGCNNINLLLEIIVKVHSHLVLGILG
jgi:hypothetical protein